MIIKNNIIGKIYKKLKNYIVGPDTIYPKPLLIQSTDKILVLAPHADDESIGCGGLLLKYSEQCEVVCVTNCKTGNPSVSEKEAIDERKNEFTMAMDSMNLKHYFNENIDSDKLKASYYLFCNLMDKYNLNQYDYIVLPVWYDQHEDHKALVVLFQRYVKDNSINLDCKILFYEVWSTIAVPNKYIDLSNLLEDKYNLISYHKSQLEYIDYRESIKGLNIYRGMIVNKKAAEVYMEISLKEFKELEL